MNEDLLNKLRRKAEDIIRKDKDALMLVLKTLGLLKLEK